MIPFFFNIKAYEPGTKCFDEVVKVFNDSGDLIGEDGKIVRAVLGRKVFVFLMSA